MNEVLTTIKERSSIRAYKAEMPAKDVLNAVIEAGLQGPTANNRQEVHISVVSTQNEVVKELVQEINAAGREGEFHYGAPVMVFLSAEKDAYFGAVDAGIACENMVLAAQSLGLSSVIIGCVWKIFEGEKKDYYGKKLGFPENHEYKIAIALGYKDTEKEPHTYDWNEKVTMVD